MPTALVNVMMEMSPHRVVFVDDKQWVMLVVRDARPPARDLAGERENEGGASQGRCFFIGASDMGFFILIAGVVGASEFATRHHYSDKCRY